MVVQCCECKLVRNGSQWVEPDPAALASAHISHGYCPSCATQAMGNLDTHYEQRVSPNENINTGRGNGPAPEANERVDLG